jgi:hypothetical protein
MMRYVYDEAVFMKEPFIMRFDIKKGEYWVVAQGKVMETAPAGDGQNKEMTLEEKRDVISGAEGGEKKIELIEVKKYSLMKKGALPSNLRFMDIMTPTGGKKIDGISDTRFFIHGYVEPTIIHIEDASKNIYTLITNPLTGKVKVLDGYLEEEKK